MSINRIVSQIVIWSCFILLSASSLMAQSGTPQRIPRQNLSGPANERLNINDTVTNRIPAIPSFTIDQNPRVLISVGVDQLNKNYVAANYRLVVTVSCTATVTLPGVTPIVYVPTYPKNLTFTVDYDRTLATDVVTDVKHLIIPNAYYVECKITAITVNGASVLAPKNAFIELKTDYIRRTDFASALTKAVTVNPIDDDADAQIDRYKLSWAANTNGSELYYEVEYAFINDFGFKYVAGIFTPLQKTKAEIEYDFKRNASKVITTKNNISINNLGQRGYLIYRIRTVGVLTAAPDKLQFGDWYPSVEKGKISDLFALNPVHVIAIADHDSKKNWQYTSVFAEDAKQKEIITYADGTLRSKQTQTRQNTETTNDLIVDEVIYDYLGRAAVKPIPAPADPQRYLPAVPAVGAIVPFKHKPSFNSTVGPYGPKDFDNDNVTKKLAYAAPLANDSGAARYYSGLNPYPSTRVGVDYTPDASGYPFSQTEYTSDGTGRVQRQGGVGPDHQLNSTHETSYMYGAPNGQTELDRYFGSDVGDFSHYKKEVVTDANGQASVTYKDMMGKVIMTSLVGSAPANLTPITGPGPATFKDKLLTNNLNLKDFSERSIKFVKEILVVKDDIYTFDYGITFDTIRPTCIPANTCFKCAYNVKYGLVDEFGVNKLPASFNPTIVGSFTQVGNNAVFTTVCNTPSVYTHPTTTATLTLPKGKYTFTKELTLRNDAVDYYVSEYFKAFKLTGCFKDSTVFINQALVSLDTVDCYRERLTCKKCVEALGDRDQFILNQYGTGADFDHLVDLCRQPCDTLLTGSSLLSTTEQQILQADMMPGGQYGGYKFVGSIAKMDSFPVSIYNPKTRLARYISLSNASPGVPLWRLPKITINNVVIDKYLNDDSTITKIKLLKKSNGQYFLDVVNPTTDIFIDPSTGGEYTFPDRLKNVSDFINLFKTSWANSLIYYHPEYAYYVNYKTFDIKPTTVGSYSSNVFDELLQNTTTYADAVTKGFITTGVPANINITNFNAKDGFLATPPLPTLATDLTTAINTYMYYNTGIPATSLSMIEAAAYTARVAPNMPFVYPVPLFGSNFVTPGSTINNAINDSIKNLEWNIFKGFYLAKKNELKFNYVHNLAINLNGSSLAEYGCNECIDNQNYDPSKVQFQTPYGWNSGLTPYADSLQPGNQNTKDFYTFKRKRFPDPANNTMTPSSGPQQIGNVMPISNGTIQNQLNYQYYLQTGKCPLAVTFEQLLDKAIRSNTFSGTNNTFPGGIQGWVDYDIDLYAHVLGLSTLIKSNIHNLNMTFSACAPTYPDTVCASGSIVDATTAATKSFSLRIGKGAYFATFNWANVKSITKIKFTSVNTATNKYGFTAQIKYFPTGSTGGFVWLSARGETDIQVGNCKFAPECKPNDFTKDLATLMSALLQKNVTATTNSYIFETLPVNLVAPNGPTSTFSFGQYLTQNVLAPFTYPKANLRWQYIPGTTDYFELYEVDNLGVKKFAVRITVDKVNPMAVPPNFTFATNIQPYIAQLAYWKPVSQNTIKVAAIDPGGFQIAELELSLALIKSPTSKEIIETSACNLPTPFGCSSKEDKVREDMQSLMMEMFYKKNATKGIQIKKYLAFSNVLQSYIPSTLQVKTFDRNQLYGPNYTVDQFYLVAGSFGGSGNYTPSQYDLNLQLKVSIGNSTSSFKNYKLKNLVKIDQVVGFGNLGSSLNKQFAAIAYFYDTVNAVVVLDTIYGTGPFPMANCFPCKDPKDLKFTFLPYPSGAIDRVDNSNVNVNQEAAVLVTNYSLYDQYKTQFKALALQKGGIGLGIENKMLKEKEFNHLYNDSKTDESFAENPEIPKEEAEQMQAEVDQLFINAVCEQVFDSASIENYNKTIQISNSTVSTASKLKYVILSYSECYQAYLRYKKIYNKAFSIYCNKCPGTVSGTVDVYACTNPLFNSNPTGTTFPNTSFYYKEISFATFVSKQLCCATTPLDNFYIYGWLDYHESIYNSIIGQNKPCTTKVECLVTPNPDFYTPAINCTTTGNEITVSKYLLQLDATGMSHGCSTSYTYTTDTTCFGLYANFLQAVSLYNATFGGNLSAVYANFQDFQQAGRCSCIKPYLLELAFCQTNGGYNANGALPVNIDQFVGCMSPNTGSSPVYSTVCDQDYALYSAAINSYNAAYTPPLPLLTSTVFYDSNYCGCASNYASFINAVVSGLITDPFDIAVGINFKKACSLSQITPCAPANIVDTLSGLPSNLVDTISPCVTIKKSIAFYNGMMRYKNYADSIMFNFKSRYVKKCMSPTESLFMTYPNAGNVTTLYYYDQAGNLVRTVPPEGVEILNLDNTTAGNALAAQIETDRKNKTKTVFTKHRMITKYYYNSLNQLTSQINPDHDKAISTSVAGIGGIDTAATVNDVHFNPGTGNGIAVTSQNFVISGTTTVAGGLVYRTTSGGVNWVKVPEALASNIRKIKMFDSLRGFAVGTNSTILRTLDGGNNWQQIPAYNKIQTDFNDLVVIAVSTHLNVLAVGNNSNMLYAQDAANTTVALVNLVKIGIPTTPPAPIMDTISTISYDATAIPAKYYIGVNSTTLKGQIFEFTLPTITTTALITLTCSALVETVLAAKNIIGINYLGNSTGNYIGYAIDNLGNLYKTLNHSQRPPQWNIINPLRANFKQIQFINKNIGIARVDTAISPATGSQIWATYNAGLNWTRVSPAGESFNEVFFSTKNVGIAYSTDATNTKKLYNILIDSANIQFSTIALPAGLTNIHSLWSGKLSTTSKSSKAIVISDGDKVYATFDGFNPSPFWMTFSPSLVNTSGIKKMAGRIISADNPDNPRKIVILAVPNNNPTRLHRIVFDETINTGLTSSFVVTNLTGQYYDLQMDSLNYLMSLKNSLSTGLGTFSIDVFPLTYIGLSGTPINAPVIAGSVTTTSKLVVTGNKVLYINSPDYFGYRAVDNRNGTISTFEAISNSTFSAYPFRINDLEVYNRNGTTNRYLLATGHNGVLLQRTLAPTAGLVTLVNTGGNPINLNAIKPYSVGISPSNFDSLLIGGDNGLLMKMPFAVVPCNNYLNCFAIKKVAGLGSNKVNDIAVNNGRAFIATNSGNVFALYNVAFNGVGNVYADAPAERNMMGIAGVNNKANDFITVGNNTALLSGNFYGFTQAQNIFLPELRAVHFSKSGTGYIVGDRQIIKRFEDYGSSIWEDVKPQTVIATTTQTFNDVSTYAENAAYVVGANRFYFPIMGNQLKNATALLTAKRPATLKLNTVHAVSKDTVFIGGLAGTIGALYRSSNASTVNNLAWDSLSNSTFKEINAVRTTNRDSIVWAAGQTGYLVYGRKTAPATYAFANSSLPTKRKMNLKSIDFLDNENGVVSGDSSKVFKIDAYLSSAGTVYDHDIRQIASYMHILPADSAKTTLVSAFVSDRIIFAGGSISGSPRKFYGHLISTSILPSSQRFYYDLLGRMVLSQNSRQAGFTKKRYSYTWYDALGRIVEVGEKEENTTAGKLKFNNLFGKIYNGSFIAGAINETKLKSWIQEIDGLRYTVSRTAYDVNNVAGYSFTNLRNRVGGTYFFDITTNAFDNLSNYAYASHYSYDIHGNVKRLLQDFGIDHYVNQRYKTIDYDYDLISGKVNKVTFQNNQIDQYIHKYVYDADNRLLEAQTSKNGIVFEKEAMYFYLPHGPLARIEYGKNRVQGIDYAYTILGWIKGINSNSLNPTHDIGKDNLYSLTTNLNKDFARDAFAYSLGYYEGDYFPIRGINFTAPTGEGGGYFGSGGVGLDTGLFNGNISHMVTSLYSGETAIPNAISSNGASFNTPSVMAQIYKYDQLNRIKKMRTYSDFDAVNNIWSTSPYRAGQNRYFYMNLSYDLNGNITKLNKYGASGAIVDSIQYHYFNNGAATPKTLQNRLYHYKDLGGNAGIGDLKNTALAYKNGAGVKNDIANKFNNFTYDAIGNLTRDSIEGINNIAWNAAGKITRIDYQWATPTRSILYEYDAQGNRIAKHTAPLGGVIAQATASTYYVRDATGNVMATYTTNKPSDGSAPASPFYKLTERHIYGSSRLGIDNRNVNVYFGTTANPTAYILPSDTSSSTSGHKYYEGSNHLGNVMASFTDRRLVFDNVADLPAGNPLVDATLPHIITSTDYYPFGSPMIGRNFTRNSGYRYGFNGKENDNEVKGQGNQQDYGMRIYDPRLARFLSVDPLAKSYPFYSPYHFAGNTPIQAIDLDGTEPDYIADKSSDGKVHLKFPVVAMFARLYGNSFLESGAKSNILIDQKIHDRVTHYKHGAITLGYEMIFTESYRPADAETWLKLIAHEKVHVNQFIKLFGSSNTGEVYKNAVSNWVHKYSMDAGSAYIDNLGEDKDKLHDKIGSESEANKFEDKFRDFYNSQDYYVDGVRNNKVDIWLHAINDATKNRSSATTEEDKLNQEKNYKENFDNLMNAIDEFKAKDDKK
jgi:RHS repeat-associated protein